MSKILVLGGLGFIGYHLSKHLSSLSHQVFIVDLLNNYLPNNFKAWSFYLQLKRNDLNSRGVNITILDIKDPILKNHIFEIEPEIIVNLASMPVAVLADLNPQKAKIDIFDSNFHILEILKTLPYKLKKYIYISSSMVYGNFSQNENNQIIPASEDQVCLPIDTYGALKYANEIMIRQYSYRHHIPFTIIRPSAVYGPTDCNMRVTEIFLKRAFRNETIELDNGGEHELDFTYIDDLIQGITKAIFSEKATNQVFNISYGQGRKIKELAYIIKQHFPNVKISTNKIKPFRPNRGALNIEKAKSLLNYQPQYPLEKGIEKYIHYLKNYIHHYDS